jgi:hypothetical protein
VDEKNVTFENREANKWSSSAKERERLTQHRCHNNEKCQFGLAGMDITP